MGSNGNGNKVLRNTIIGVVITVLTGIAITKGVPLLLASIVEDKIKEEVRAAIDSSNALQQQVKTSMDELKKSVKENTKARNTQESDLAGLKAQVNAVEKSTDKLVQEISDLRKSVEQLIRIQLEKGN